MKEILPHTVREEQRGLNREIITVVTTVDASTSYRRTGRVLIPI